MHGCLQLTDLPPYSNLLHVRNALDFLWIVSAVQDTSGTLLYSSHLFIRHLPDTPQYWPPHRPAYTVLHRPHITFTPINFYSTCLHSTGLHSTGLHSTGLHSTGLHTGTTLACLPSRQHWSTHRHHTIAALACLHSTQHRAYIYRHHAGLSPQHTALAYTTLASRAQHTALAYTTLASRAQHNYYTNYQT